MPKFDTEDLLISIKNVMVVNDALNTKIAQIEAEKATKGQTLDPVLKTISAEAYHAQTWSDKVLQNNPAIFYGVEDVSSVNGGRALGKIYKIFIEVVLVDSGMQNDTHLRIARYARALEELFETAETPEIPVAQMRIDTVRPMAFKLALDSDEEIKVGGITLTIALV